MTDIGRLEYMARWKPLEERASKKPTEELRGEVKRYLEERDRKMSVWEAIKSIFDKSPIISGDAYIVYIGELATRNAISEEEIAKWAGRTRSNKWLRYSLDYAREATERSKTLPENQ